MKTKKRIAVITYNRIRNWPNGLKQFPRGTAHVYSQMFTREGQKSEEYATESDELFQEFLREDTVRPFDLIIPFEGKETSGGVNMVTIFCHPRFAGRVLHIVCDHDGKEKFDRFRSCGVDPETSPMVIWFKDNLHPCREPYLLKGIVAEELGG